MVKIWKFCVLFILVLFSSVIWGQPLDTMAYKERIRELFYSGMELTIDGRDIEALDTFRLFLDYRKKIYGEHDYLLGSPYSNIGIAYKNLGQYTLALENFKLAEQNYLLRKDPNIASLAKLYRNIGNVYRAKLDYPKALEYSEQALSIFQQQNPIDREDISDAIYAIAELEFLLGNYNISLSKLINFVDQTDNLNKIYFYELIAIVNQALGNNQAASKYYQRTIQFAKSYYGNENINLAKVYLNYVEFLATTNEFETGLVILQKAFQIIVQTQNKNGIELAGYYQYKGDLIKFKPIATENIISFKKLKKENLKSAITCYSQSINALSSKPEKININNIRIENCLSFIDCMTILKSIADTYNDLALLEQEVRNDFYISNLENALTYYSITSQLIQQARKEISSDDSKIQLAELEYTTFSKTIETAYLAFEASGDNKYVELAFNNSEQLKSSAVFDKLSNDLAQENSLIPDSLLQYEKKLNNIISTYTQKIFEENNSTNTDSVLIQEYDKKIFEASRERDEFNRTLEKTYPDYYELKYSSSMLTISEIQEKMKKDEVLFEYVIVEPKIDKTVKDDDNLSAELFTILISKTKSIFHKSTMDCDIKSSLENVFTFMSNPNYIFTKNTDSKEFCVSSYKLYNLLIHPFVNELKNKSLVIIPDGKLSYISFDGLLQNLPDTSELVNFTQLNYLIKDYNINYANSANILFKNRSNSKKITNSTLAFAPEYKSEQFEMSDASYTLLPLPGVQKEVDAIAKSINTKIFRGAEATEQNFRKYSNEYDILHLAMHAYINDSLPGFSRLAFAPQPKGQPLTQDGWLNTTDIYNLDLNARLAVLSACNTGIGKLKKGEGMMSLARGFLYAGCPSVIMSLWEVEDESGTKIMSSFYKNIKKGKTKDEALRLAKLNYLQNSNSRMAHPHYWMSFRCIGDNSPIYTSYDVYFFALLIILILAFTVDQTIRIRKLRNKEVE